MKVNGTLINYYIHCRRQCYLAGNRLNLEDNSELVKVGKAIHEEKSEESKNTEIEIDNVKIDKMTSEYVIEIKKSDADIEASKWQLLYYLMILKNKGVIRRGKLQCVEKNKTDKKIIYLDLTPEIEEELARYVQEISELIQSNNIPAKLNKASCKKCGYYEYCYI